MLVGHRTATGAHDRIAAGPGRTAMGKPIPDPMSIVESPKLPTCHGVIAGFAADRVGIALEHRGNLWKGMLVMPLVAPSSRDTPTGAVRRHRLTALAIGLRLNRSSGKR
jgi:hypothetical protein